MRQDDDTVSQPKARFHTRSHKKALYSTTAWYQTGLRGLGCLSMHSQVQAAHYVKSDDVDKDMIKRYIYIYICGFLISSDASDGCICAQIYRWVARKVRNHHLPDDLCI